MLKLFSGCVCVFSRGFRGWVGARQWWRSTCPSSATWSRRRLSTCAPASRWWSPTSLPVRFQSFMNSVQSCQSSEVMLVILTSLICCLRNMRVCLFPERVTICEGGVDISDTDDEDESRCHPSYFKEICMY